MTLALVRVLDAHCSGCGEAALGVYIPPDKTITPFPLEMTTAEARTLESDCDLCGEAVVCAMEPVR